MARSTTDLKTAIEVLQAIERGDPVEFLTTGGRWIVWDGVGIGALPDFQRHPFRVKPMPEVVYQVVDGLSEYWTAKEPSAADTKGTVKRFVEDLGWKPEKGDAK